MRKRSTKVSRPWGGFTQFSLNEQCTVKIIEVAPGGRLSLQTHKNRDELWHIISGTGTVTIGSVKLRARPGSEFWIPRTLAHRASSKNGMSFLEVAFGHFDEGDEVRLADDYGRT